MCQNLELLNLRCQKKKQKTLNCKYPTVNKSLVGKDRHENLNETACNVISGAARTCENSL